MLRTAIVAVGLMLSQTASAAILYSSATNDNGLWTYNYSIDNNTSSPIWELSVLVVNGSVRAPSGFIFDPLPMPVAHSSPDGWSMHVSHSGGIASSPYNMSGMFYQWYSPTGGAAPSSVLGGFSFSVYAAPESFSVNNQFLFGDAGVLEYGAVMGPDLTLTRTTSVAPPLQFGNIRGVPEPSTWIMMLLGFFGLVLVSEVYRVRERSLMKHLSAAAAGPGTLSA